jgi:hypothetical protein
MSRRLHRRSAGVSGSGHYREATAKSMTGRTTALDVNGRRDMPNAAATAPRREGTSAVPAPWVTQADDLQLRGELHPRLLVRPVHRAGVLESRSAKTAAIAGPGHSIGSRAPGSFANGSACCSRSRYQPWAAQARRQAFSCGSKSKASIRARCASTRPLQRACATHASPPPWSGASADCGRPRTGCPPGPSAAHARPGDPAPLQRAAARMVNPSGPISPAMEMMAVATSRRHRAGGGPRGAPLPYGAINLSTLLDPRVRRITYAD